MPFASSGRVGPASSAARSAAGAGVASGGCGRAAARKGRITTLSPPAPAGAPAFRFASARLAWRRQSNSEALTRPNSVAGRSVAAGSASCSIACWPASRTTDAVPRLQRSSRSWMALATATLSSARSRGRMPVARRASRWWSRRSTATRKRTGSGPPSAIGRQGDGGWLTQSMSLAAIVFGAPGSCSRSTRSSRSAVPRSVCNLAKAAVRAVSASFNAWSSRRTCPCISANCARRRASTSAFSRAASPERSPALRLSESSDP